VTPGQAKEFATRIRLGEPVFLVVEKPLHAVFADGTVVAKKARERDSFWVARYGTLVTSRRLLQLYASIPYILLALDRVAQND
jgi:hypothetical protein